MNHASPTPEFDRVIEDVRQARHHQIEKGFTPEHDDRHHPYTHSLVEVAKSRLNSSHQVEDGYYDRQMLIDNISVMVAAVEAWDRREKRNG